MSAPLVAVTCIQLQRDLDQVRDRLNAAGVEIRVPNIPGQELAGDELIAAMDNVVGVIAGDDKFDSQVLASCPQLRVISKWGIGIDGIDLKAAAELGIVVRNTPGMFGNEVAENALGYLIGLVRGHFIIDRGIRSGSWPKPVGRSLSALTVGVVGLGDIGLSTALKCLALGMTVSGYDPSAEANQRLAAAGGTAADLDSVVSSCDVLVLTAPLNDATHHMMSAERFALMRPGAFLVNVGRGPLVDTDALINALSSGALGGAALDVFEVEPLPTDHPLLRFDSVIVGSHNSSNTAEACARTHQVAVDHLLEELAERGIVSS